MMDRQLFTITYTILEFCNCFLVYTVIFRAKVKDQKQCFLWLLPAVFVSCFFLRLKGAYFAQRMVVISGISLPLFIFKGERRKWFLLYPAAMMFSSTVTVYFSFILAVFKNIPEVIVINNEDDVLISEAGTLLILVLIGFYEKCQKKDSFEIEFFGKQYLVLYAGVICAFIMVGCAQGFSEINMMSNQEKNLFGLAVTGICFLFFLIGVRSGIIINNRNKYLYQMEMLRKYMEMQEKQIALIIQKEEKLKAYRHDMKAHLLVLQSFYENDDREGYQEYMNEIIQNSNIFHKVVYTGNVAVDAVLNHLGTVAGEQGIFVSYECILPGQLRIALFDLCTILSNLIQNAIDACVLNEQGKEISVKIYPFDQKIYIVVKNPVESLVKIEGNGLVTTKEDKGNHGLGSRNVGRVVEKYHGKIYYNCDSGWFTAEILI